MLYLSAYVNRNGIFIVYRDHKRRYFLQKMTFGKENYVRVRIRLVDYERLECCSSDAESWTVANELMSKKLEEHNQKKMKKYQGNC